MKVQFSCQRLTHKFLIEIKWSVRVKLLYNKEMLSYMDSLSSNNLSQDLYYTHNLPRKTHTYTPKNEPEVKHFKNEQVIIDNFILVLKWIFLTVVFPFHLVFQTIPTLIINVTAGPIKILKQHIERFKAFCHKTFYLPVVHTYQWIDTQLITPAIEAVVAFIEKINRKISSRYEKAAAFIRPILKVFSDHIDALLETVDRFIARIGVHISSVLTQIEHYLRELTKQFVEAPQQTATKEAKQVLDRLNAFVLNLQEVRNKSLQESNLFISRINLFCETFSQKFRETVAELRVKYDF